MRKALTILLALFVVVSMSGVVLADDPDKKEVPFSHTGDQKPYWSLTVPQDSFATGIAQTIVLSGMWAPETIRTFSIPDSIVMTNTNGDTVSVPVESSKTFPLELPGSYQEVSETFTITVDPEDTLSKNFNFGTWTGSVTFTMKSGKNEGYVPTKVVSTTAELKDVLTGAGAAGAGDTVISLTSDIEITAADNWQPINVDGYHGAGVITINGNGNTITGLTAPLLSGGFAGDSGIVIKDLTIKSATITSDNSLGCGAFINTVDSMQEITLINCHLIDSTITDTNGARTGGLIGWTAGYDNENNGPVDTYVTITGCSVTGCTITAAGSVGAIIGHAGNNPATYHTITNCVVKNCQLTSNDDSYRVGAIVGTANVGEVTISDCTSTGNTFKQDNKGTEIARPQGQSELYGRFVPGSTGKLTIDGIKIE